MLLPDQQIKTSIDEQYAGDKRPIYTSFDWVNWRKEGCAQVKMCYEPSPTSMCDHFYVGIYLDVISKGSAYSLRDSLLRTLYDAYAPEGAKPSIVNEYTIWQKNVYSFISPKYIPLTDIAKTAIDAGIKFSLVLTFDGSCMHRESFSDWGYPLNPGEVGQEFFLDGSVKPFFRKRNGCM